MGACARAARANKLGRGMRQGKLKGSSAPVAPFADCVGGWTPVVIPKRLSATDISALASMKNVAKCDTWCELQNPVNHRVFERKLRPKPLGRGHVCLGVTRRCPPRPLPESGGTDGDLPCASRAVGLNIESPATGAATIGGCETSVSCRARVRRGLSRTLCVGHPTLSTRPQVRRGYPLNLSISISGGKETYKDSLSNGERTGNSPA